MSSANEDLGHSLLAKQNPETGAALLRKLSRAQLHLWQEIGRKGLPVSELSMRHVGRDMLQEVRILEAQGVVILQEISEDLGREAFSSHGQLASAGQTPIEDKDPRVREPIARGTRRPKRSSAAIEKSDLKPGRKQAPTEPANTHSLAEEHSQAGPISALRRPARSTSAVEMPARNPKSLRKHSGTAPPQVDRDEDKTAEARPAAEARRAPRPTAAVERPTKRIGRRSSATGPFLSEGNEDATKPATPVAARARPRRLTAAIEKPTRPRKKKERATRPPSSPERHEPGSSVSQQEPPLQTSPIEGWSHSPPVSMSPDPAPLEVDTGAIGDWAARGTQAATQPAMPNPLPVEHARPVPKREPQAASSGQHSTAGMDTISLLGNQGAPEPLLSGALELNPDELTDEEREFMKLEVDLSIEEKRRVLDVARAVKTGDICGLLRLPNTADRKQIKRAYFALSQELHPDQYFGRNLGGFKVMLEQAFTSLAQYVKALNDKRTTLPNSFRTSAQARRRSQRFHLSLRAQVQCDSWTGPQWTVTQDISSGGAFLITDVEANLGEAIRLNVESPNGTIGIVGKVVSMREADQARRQRRNSGLGIQFQTAAEVDANRLKALLEEARRRAPAFTGSVPVKSEAAKKLAKKSKKIHKEKSIIGIDLGTTNTAVSAVIDNRVQIIPWPDGSYSLPSVVGFPERGRCIVGYEAQAHLLSDPRHVINSGKRLVGRQYDDPEIASFMSEARFKSYKGPDGTVIVKLWDEDYAIPQICSYLFSAAKHAATQTLGTEPTKAVITVPVSFDEMQIECMRRAARLAQLDVVEVIEEPCAAAIANQGQKDFNGIVGVYDFGGGTFDFSLVEAGSGDLRVLATTGDSWLGGDDFDLAIADAAANMFWKAEGTDLREKAVEWQYLVLACEKAKRDLSLRDHAQVVVPDVSRNAQGSVDLRINLAREKVELLWAQPIRRSIDTCKQALSLAGVPMSRLSAIYMSGGTSYIPAIRRSLMKSFGVPVHLGLAPEHAVCAGAGIRAAILQGS